MDADKGKHRDHSHWNPSQLQKMQTLSDQTKLSQDS